VTSTSAHILPGIITWGHTVDPMPTVLIKMDGQAPAHTHVSVILDMKTLWQIKAAMTSMNVVTKGVQDVPIHVFKQHPIMESVSTVLEVILVTHVMWQGQSATQRTIKSHAGQGGSYSYYSSSMNKQWALKVTEGKRIRLTITAFNTESCCDKLYFTWTACEHGFFSYDWYLSGTPSVPRTYESPVGINAVNLLFKSDGSVQKSGWRLTWEAF